MRDGGSRLALHFLPLNVRIPRNAILSFSPEPKSICIIGVPCSFQPKELAPSSFLCYFGVSSRRDRNSEQRLDVFRSDGIFREYSSHEKRCKNAFLHTRGGVFTYKILCLGREMREKVRQGKRTRHVYKSATADAIGKRRVAQPADYPRQICP